MFAFSGPSSFGQVASTTAESVPAWKTDGDTTFGSGGQASSVGHHQHRYLGWLLPLQSLFSLHLNLVQVPRLSFHRLRLPHSRRQLRHLRAPYLSPLPPTVPLLRGDLNHPRQLHSTYCTSPLTAADLSKPPVPWESTTPARPSVPNVFMVLKMSTGFGLSNFNAKDSPFTNSKPVSQTVSPFRGAQNACAGHTWVCVRPPDEHLRHRREAGFCIWSAGIWLSIYARRRYQLYTEQLADWIKQPFQRI